MPATGFAEHNHAGCIRQALAAAERRCRGAGLRLTPVRRRVLEILLAEHRALGAYEILDRLAAEGLGSAPAIAYRALDFLVTAGLAHRIEGLNAFVACCLPGRPHQPAFLVCRRCHRVAETLEARLCAPDGALGRAAGDSGFAIERAVVEVEGLCPTCRKDAPSAAGAAGPTAAAPS